MAAVRSFVVASLVVVIAAKPSGADSAETYDLDSLAWIATDIVEGTVIHLDEEIYGVSTVEVTAVHDGDLQVGKTIPIHFLKIYRKAGETFRQTGPLESGDKLVLFLHPAEPATGFTPAGPNAMTVVATGIRLIRYGHVVPFRQLSNPGPLVAPTPTKDEASNYASVEKFRNQVAEAIDTAAKLKLRFAEPPSPEDVPELLDLLRKRIADPIRLPHRLLMAPRDKAAEEVCMRLANMHHMDALSTALFLDLRDWHCLYAIKNGFACPRGRDFLLAEIGDETVSMERRLRYGAILRDVGREYYSKHTKIGTYSTTIIGLDHDDNGGYLTRVAGVTADVMDQEELCLAMLHAMERFAGSLPGLPDDDPIRVDLRGALPALVELHRQTDSVRIRYDVENVIALISRSKYHSLGSKCGPILSLVQPDNRKGYDKPDSGEFDYRYCVIVLDGSSSAEAELVFTHEESDREFTIPFEIRHHGRRSHRGFRRVSLPEDLPPGRYHVFLRFVRDGKVVSEGYGFETEL